MKNKSLLDSIKSPLPCSKDWNEMTGDERVRFCAGCRKDVYNLSAMTRREATRFVARNSGKVCVRYVRRADGAVETADSKFHQITRRAPLIAAGALGAMLVVSANAQTPATPQTESTQTIRTKKQNNSATSQISFTVYSSAREGIPNAEVKLINRKTNQEFILLTNSAGIVQFSLLPRGDYDVKISAREFTGFTRPVRIKEPIEPNLEIYLEIGVSEFVGVVVDVWSEVPLFTSIAQEDNDEVKRTILSGFDVNTRDKKGQTALHVAVLHANLEIIRFLLERGADVNAKNNEKLPPLWMLEEEELNPEIFKLLIAKGADVNVRNRQKETLLMLACEDDNFEIVRILLEAGAKPNVRDEDGETAIEKTNSEEIKQLLKQHEAKER